MSASAVGKRGEAGRLFRIRRGVYAVHPPPFTTQQWWMAAVLACGPGTLLSDWPAGEHWGISILPSPAIHVTVPRGAGRGAPDLVAHRRGTIDPRDVRRKEGIPLTSVDLVLVHLAPHLDEAELETMLVAAESLGLLKRGRLAELVGQRRERPGITKLGSLLELEPATVRSDVELLLIPMYRRAGLPRPRINYPIAVPGRTKPLTVDLAWPEIRLAFELDTQRFHGEWAQAEEDRERDQLLGLVSWACHRFFRTQLVERPEEAADRARRLYELRAAAYE